MKRTQIMKAPAMANVQMAITPKVLKAELRFLCSARRLIVLYICVKFHETVPELCSGHESLRRWS